MAPLSGEGYRASTAIHNGARFPLVSPSGGLAGHGHVIDGGYFDNSGAELIRQMINYLNLPGAVPAGTSRPS